MKSLNLDQPHASDPRLLKDGELASGGLLVLDAFGTVLTANQAAILLFGDAADQLIGHNIGHFVALDTLTSTSQGRAGSMSALTDGPQVLGGLRSDGEVFSLRLVVTQIWFEDEVYFKGVIEEVSLPQVDTSTTNSPIDSATKQATATDTAEPTDDVLALRSLHILLAEDHPVNQLLVGMLLTQLGHSHVAANNGQEALDRHAAQAFDLILMDVMMPIMDGLTAMAAVRVREAGSARRTPVIVVTAHAMLGDRERFLAAGADGYVSKPISARALQAEMLRVVEAAGTAAAVSQAPPNLLSPSASIVD